MINVVFPVLNEELRLEKGIQTVVPFLSEHWMGNFQITIVDNGSTDKTEQLCQQLCKKYNEIKYLRIEEKGVGVAFRYAVEQNECEIIGYTDIDLSTELEAFVQMKKAFEEDQKNALNAGMNGHIAKPLDIQKLFQVLSELLK